MGMLDTVALAVVLFAGRLPGGLYATVTASLFGVVTILLAWAFLKERLLPLQWIGVGVTFAAVGLLSAT
jgi:drug/metabolite transporter (DMT)-like permease